MSYPGKPFHEISIIRGETTECSHIRNIGQPWPISNDVGLQRVTLDSSLTHHMAQEGHLFLKQMALGGLESQGLPLTSTSSMVRANWLGALQSPKLSTLKRHCPFCVTKAVLSRSSSSMRVCQYPCLRSQLLSHFDPFSMSKQVSILGSGK